MDLVGYYSGSQEMGFMIIWRARRRWVKRVERGNGKWVRGPWTTGVIFAILHLFAYFVL